MAKDVDLSSSEWIDIIFEGKNKDFGAYELRKASTKRHNRAMLVILIVLLLCSRPPDSLQTLCSRKLKSVLKTRLSRP